MHVPISLVAVAFVFSVTAADKCYNATVDFYELMGTRTAYELVHGKGNLRTIKDPKCKPLQIWVLARHGTKYPENEDVPKLIEIVDFRDQIVENHENGQGELCDADVKKFRDWKLDSGLNYQTNEELAPQGEKDLEEFAKRLKAAYPDLLKFDPKTFKPTDVLYKSTNRQRTVKSMMAFNKGIFDDSVTAVDATIVQDNDTLLMPHKTCKAWREDYITKDLSSERNEFVKGTEINGILMRVSKRLGFKGILDYDTVRSAYDMCRYEVAWYPNKVSTWCTIFKKRDLEIFEYSEDLEFYYCCGPGREMSGKIGCHALADMFAHFKEIEAGNEKSQPKGIFYFGHSMTLQTMLAAMKIGKEDTPFTAKTFEKAMQRKYHVSKLGPFATNVVAVMYRCRGTNPIYKVTLHVAEAPAPISMCKNGICNWEDLKKEYRSTVDNCNLDFCPTNKGESDAGVMLVSFEIVTTVFISLITVIYSSNGV